MLRQEQKEQKKVTIQKEHSKTENQLQPENLTMREEENDKVGENMPQPQNVTFSSWYITPCHFKNDESKSEGLYLLVQGSWCLAQISVIGI